MLPSEDSWVTPASTHQCTRPGPQTHPRSCRCPPAFPRKQRVNNARWPCTLSKSEEPVSSFVQIFWLTVWWLLAHSLTSLDMFACKRQEMVSDPILLSTIFRELSLQKKMCLWTQRKPGWTNQSPFSSQTPPGDLRGTQLENPGFTETDSRTNWMKEQLNWCQRNMKPHS
jgi:hypothetical protein